MPNDPNDPITVKCSWCHGTLLRNLGQLNIELLKTASFMDAAARELNRPEDGDRYTSNGDRFQLRQRAESLRQLAEFLNTL